MLGEWVWLHGRPWPSLIEACITRALCFWSAIAIISLFRHLCSKGPLKPVVTEFCRKLKLQADVEAGGAEALLIGQSLATQGLKKFVRTHVRVAANVVKASYVIERPFLEGLVYFPG